MESTGSIHPEPFRIALVTDGLFPLSIGGMQKHSAKLAAHLAEAGARVFLFHPHRDLLPEQVFTEQQQKAIHCIYVPWPAVPSFPGHYLFRNYQYSRAVDRIIREHKVDAVYVQGFSGWKSVCSAPKTTPVVLNLHGMEMFQPLRGIRNRMNGLMLRIPARQLMRRADAVVSLGGKLSDIIRKEAPGRNIIELPVGIDDQWLEKVERDKTSTVRTILFVGRYEWRKGLDLLNQVIPEVLDVFPEPLRFSFIGDIPQEHRVNHPQVHYYGPLRDEQKIRTIYHSSDILVCPSYSEGMPTVILEAMASGLPVLATNVGAVSLLVSSANGRLIEPGSASSLKAALLELLQSNTNQLHAMQISSAKKAAEFSWAKVARLSLQRLQEANRLFFSRRS